MNIEKFYKAIEFSSTYVGKGKQAAIINVLRENTDRFAYLMYSFAFNKNLVYGVDGVVPAISGSGDCTDGDPVIELLMNLSSGMYNSKNDMFVEIDTVLSNYPVPFQKIVVNIIRGTNRFGFTEKILNTALISLGFDPIRSHDVMKAAKLKSIDEYKKYFSVDDVYRVEYKYDGERTVVENKNNVRMYTSRNGLFINKNQFDNKNLQQELDEFDRFFFSKYDEYPVIDCEKFFGSFTQTANAKKSGADLSNIALRMFFVMPDSHWKNRETTFTNELVDSLYNEFVLHYTILHGTKPEHLLPCEWKIAKSFEEIDAIYNHVLSIGQEGVIIKKPSGTYEWTRSKDWMKMVPCDSVDLLIVGPIS